MKTTKLAQLASRMFFVHRQCFLGGRSLPSITKQDKTKDDKPLKTNMEPKNDDLEDVFSFSNGWLSGSMLNFGGVNPWKSRIAFVQMCFFKYWRIPKDPKTSTEVSLKGWIILDVYVVLSLVCQGRVNAR